MVYARRTIFNCGGGAIQILKEAILIAPNLTNQSAYLFPSLNVRAKKTTQRREVSF